MRSRRLGSAFLALMLVAIVGILTPIAQASPPDPSWIRGMYDDNDFDDVVGLITSGAGLVSEITRIQLRPVLIVITAILPPDDRPVPSLSLPSARPRAPLRPRSSFRCDRPRPAALGLLLVARANHPRIWLWRLTSF